MIGEQHDGWGTALVFRWHVEKITCDLLDLERSAVRAVQLQQLG